MRPVSQWKNKILDLTELSEMYVEKAGQWVLLEIVGYDQRGQANRVRVVEMAPDKDELLDYLMDREDQWDWNKRFVIVRADPGLCTLI